MSSYPTNNTRPLAVTTDTKVWSTLTNSVSVIGTSKPLTSATGLRSTSTTTHSRGRQEGWGKHIGSLLDRDGLSVKTTPPRHLARWAVNVPTAVEEKTDILGFTEDLKKNRLLHDNNGACKLKSNKSIKNNRVMKENISGNSETVYETPSRETNTSVTNQNDKNNNAILEPTKPHNNCTSKIRRRTCISKAPDCAARIRDRGRPQCIPVTKTSGEKRHLREYVKPRNRSFNRAASKEDSESQISELGMYRSQIATHGPAARSQSAPNQTKHVKITPGIVTYQNGRSQSCGNLLLSMPRKIMPYNTEILSTDNSRILYIKSSLTNEANEVIPKEKASIKRELGSRAHTLTQGSGQHSNFSLEQNLDRLTRDASRLDTTLDVVQEEGSSQQFVSSPPNPSGSQAQSRRYSVRAKGSQRISVKDNNSFYLKKCNSLDLQTENKSEAMFVDWDFFSKFFNSKPGDTIDIRPKKKPVKAHLELGDGLDMDCLKTYRSRDKTERHAFCGPSLITRPHYMDLHLMAMDKSRRREEIHQCAQMLKNNLPTTHRGVTGKVLSLYLHQDQVVSHSGQFQVYDVPDCSLKVRWRLTTTGDTPTLTTIFVLLNRRSKLICLTQVSQNCACAVFETMSGAARALSHVNQGESQLIVEWWRLDALGPRSALSLTSSRESQTWLRKTLDVLNSRKPAKTQFTGHFDSASRRMNAQTMNRVKKGLAEMKKRDSTPKVSPPTPSSPAAQWWDYMFDTQPMVNARGQRLQPVTSARGQTSPTVVASRSPHHTHVEDRRHSPWRRDLHRTKGMHRLRSSSQPSLIN